ncbi:MAG: RNA pseudouridine synthase, partial [Oscillospiraceae bacterium]|nr:RNA pseudouridine synthase [Oscillospiraceae bacterium]
DPAGELSFAPALVNRIDRNTRGIVIAAKTAAALRILNEKLKNRELRKYYLCAVHGLPKQGEPLRDDWRQLHCYLLKNEAKNTARIFQNPCAGAKECFTNYRVAAQKNGLSLLEIELLTGRTHQIRAQFAAIGHALVGDGKYAPRALYQKCGYTSQLLCSHRLVFDFLTPADELEYLNQLDIRVKNIQFTENLFHLKY